MKRKNKHEKRDIRLTVLTAIFIILISAYIIYELIIIFVLSLALN